MKIVVLRAGCSYRQMLETILAQRGVVGLRQLEFGTWQSIFSAVAAGIGTTLLPKGMIGPVLEDGRVTVHRLPRREATVQTVFIRRRDAYLSSAMRAFLVMARSDVVELQAAE
jgi:DNA-binding transcriptional LysR family regulator